MAQADPAQRKADNRYRNCSSGIIPEWRFGACALAGTANRPRTWRRKCFSKRSNPWRVFAAARKFSTWLYTIARNHCYNHARASAAVLAPMEESLEISLADETPDAYHRLERESSAEVFNGLVKESLTELETQAITLHYVEELPLDVVTRLLNLENQSGAKSYIVSARRKLARAMERWKAREQRVRP